jgi:hypothetical protein
MKVLRRLVESALHAPIRMMDQVLADPAATGPYRHLKRIKSEISAQ